MVPRLDPRRYARRLRRIGTLVLLLGMLCAAGLYWLETSHAAPGIEELLPGSRAAAARQTGLLYGPGVQSLWEIYQELKQPAGQAFLIATTALVVAALCFRAAWLRDHGDEL